MKKKKKFFSSVQEKTVGYLLAAFGLVAGLAWNDAIKALIDTYWPLDQGSLTAKFVYAGAITFLVVAVTAVLVKFSKDKDGDDK